MVLEEAAAGFLYSLKKQRSAACEAQPAKRSLRSAACEARLVSQPLLRGPQRGPLRPEMWHRAGTRERQYFVEQAPTGGCARTDAARPVHIRSVGFLELLYHLLFARHPQHVHGTNSTMLAQPAIQ